MVLRWSPTRQDSWLSFASRPDSIDIGTGTGCILES